MHMSMSEGCSTKRRMRKGGTPSTVQSMASLPFGRSIQWREEKELTALLQQRATCGSNGAPIVIVGVL
jgi:hypothetical protein